MREAGRSWRGQWGVVAVLVVEPLALWLSFEGVDGGVWRWRHTVGALLLAPAVALWALARFQLGDSFTARAEARRLVTHGLYSRIRNPIYLFAEIAMGGTAIFMGRWLILMASLATVPFQVRRAHREARLLEEAFGEEYREYRRKTWF